ncbi:MAG: Phenylacetic acid catabolic protein, partial [Halobacteriaceae archaeon]
ILQFFGPTDDQSKHHDFSAEVGLKTMSNDELRQAFLNAYIPKAKKYGLEIPDHPRINYDEDTGRYDVREEDLDWDEFWEVTQNEYSGSKEQINSRKQARQAVEWVRESIDEFEQSQTGTSPTAAD